MKGKTYRILNEICLLPSGRLGNGLGESMLICLLTETVKTAMNVPVTTDGIYSNVNKVYFTSHFTFQITLICLILVSYNWSFTTLDENPIDFDRFRPPRRMNPNESRARISARQCESGVWGRLKSPVRNRRRRPLLDTPASTIKKIKTKYNKKAVEM